MSDHQNLQRWVEHSLPSQFLTSNTPQLFPLSGDAGFRRYFRVACVPPLIAVSAPPEHENNEAFVRIAGLFRRGNVRTPYIYDVDYQQGFLLLEDFGDQLLLPLLSAETADQFYQKAEDTLLDLQCVPLADNSLPVYSRHHLLDEMRLFPVWFLSQLLGLDVTNEDSRIIEQAFEQLLANALSQPEVIVHRDFHSRNLMPLADGEMGVIDFQDAVRGPLTYDLVSLLRDCYIRWPAEYVSGRALNYFRRAVAAGIADTVPDSQFLRWFDLMGLQRHLKVLGIFARLWLRDGKQGYLADLPLVLHYTLEQLAPYPELHDFQAWFEKRVMPVAQTQPWYQIKQAAPLTGK